MTELEAIGYLLYSTGNIVDATQLQPELERMLEVRMMNQLRQAVRALGGIEKSVKTLILVRDLVVAAGPHA